MPPDLQPASTHALLTTSPARGSLIVTQHTVRKMKAYVLYESELRTISTINNQMVLWTSIGSVAATALIGCIWDILNSPTTDSQPSAADLSIGRAQVGFMVLCLVIAVGSFVAAWRYSVAKGSELERIQSETATDPAIQP